MKNPPAFPVSRVLVENPTQTHFLPGNEGMALRDYFAAAAMQAMIAPTGNGPAREIAKHAYDMADLMLLTRNL